MTAPLLLLSACSGATDAPATTADAGREAAVDLGVAPTKLGKIVVDVRYGGSRKGQLALGAFTEQTPKSRPPVAFDTSKVPAFPYAGELRGLEPGRYWVIALLDAEPFSGAAVKPGAEDVQVTSAAIDIVGDDVKSITLDLGSD